MPRSTGRPPRRPPAASTSWDALATWYDGWVGPGGSEHHRKVAVPAAMDLLDLQPGESALDIGAGQGVLAPVIARAGGRYVGVDASPRLLEMARRHHGEQGTFLLGDARALAAVRGLKAASFDAVIFLLSLQDMDPLGDALAGAAWALRPRGRAVLLLTHPAFRVPRQSGWGWDEGRKLLFRRIDRYLTPLAVPMKSLPGRQTSAPTRSFHRPIQDYVNGLAAHGMLVERMEEIPGHKLTRNPDHPRAEEMARREIPLFLGLRARKLSP